MCRVCLDYALGHCSEEHNQYSSNVDEFRKITKEVVEALEGIPDPGKKSSPSKSWGKIVSNHKEHLAHIVCTKHQGGLLLVHPCKPLSWLDSCIVIDYKMKVELGLRAHENQREWYGKRGISLHGFLVIAQVSYFLDSVVAYVSVILIHHFLFLDFAVKSNLSLCTS